jgi:hypothetical protein
MNKALVLRGISALPRTGRIDRSGFAEERA